ncbi:MAG: T9SS type A sorting domain-containing protein [Candidatus Cloacimonetes bacterium]|nr:T9SS type A sorting domain-containing protein [Candidatus Cloacimonadota bacterium]
MRTTIILLFLLLTLSLFSTTHTVRQNGQGDFTVIQSAIDASVNGDTVLVHPGTYFENLVINYLSITLGSLELTTDIQQYRYSTIVNGNQSGSCVAVIGTSGTVTLYGLTFTNGSGYVANQELIRGGGVYITPIDTAYLTNCVIHHNRARSGGGLHCGAYDTFLAGTSISDNHANTWAGGGIYIPLWSQVAFDPVNRCSIYHNWAGEGQDIASPQTEVVTAVILDTFSVLNPTGFFAAGSRVPSNPGDIFTFDIQHGYYTPVNHDLYVAPDGDDSNSGLSPYEPLRTILYAMHLVASDSLNPKTVHIASGIYNRSDNNQKFPLSVRRHVTLEGNPDSWPILDFEMGTGGIWAPPYNDPVTIRNFVLENIGDPYSSAGLSFQHLYSDSLTLVENIILQNITREFYAGIKFTKGSRNGIFRNITFKDNTAQRRVAGIFFQEAEDILVENCRFENLHTQNLDDLGGFNAFYSKYAENVTIRNSSFYNCTTTRSWGTAAINMTPNNDVFVPNFLVENCVVADCNNVNSSKIVAIYAVNGGHATVTGCTFVNNTSTLSTFDLLGNVDVSNSIFLNNSPNEISLINPGGGPPPTTLNIDYCNIQGGQSAILNEVPSVYTVNYGTHNIDVNPHFVGSGQHPYNLQPTFPCIDAGDPATTMPWDIVYNERVWDGDNDGTAVADIGAYEYQPIFPAVNLTAQVNLTDVLLNWDEPQTFNRSLNGYRVYRDSLWAGDIDDPTNTQITDTNVEPGTHEYYIVALYGTMESDSTNHVTVTVDSTSYQPPYNLQAETVGSDVQLTWQHTQAGQRLVTAYGVYRDSVLIAVNENPSDTTYLDETMGTGLHGFAVTAYYGYYQTVPTDTAWVEITAGDEITIPLVTCITSVAPNPFNPVTTIRFGLKEAGEITLSIYNITGQKVVTLKKGFYNPGNYSAIWKGIDHSGKKAGSGVYFVRLKTPNEEKTRKLLLLK